MFKDLVDDSKKYYDFLHNNNMSEAATIFNTNALKFCTFSSDERIYFCEIFVNSLERFIINNEMIVTLISHRNRLYEYLINEDIADILCIVAINDIIKDYNNTIYLFIYMDTINSDLLQRCWESYGFYFLGNAVVRTGRYEIAEKYCKNPQNDLLKILQAVEKKYLSTEKLMNFLEYAKIIGNREIPAMI